MGKRTEQGQGGGSNFDLSVFCQDAIVCDGDNDIISAGSLLSWVIQRGDSLLRIPSPAALKLLQWLGRQSVAQVGCLRVQCISSSESITAPPGPLGPWPAPGRAKGRMGPKSRFRSCTERSVPLAVDSCAAVALSCPARRLGKAKRQSGKVATGESIEAMDKKLGIKHISASASFPTDTFLSYSGVDNIAYATSHWKFMVLTFSATAQQVLWQRKKRRSTVQEVTLEHREMVSLQQKDGQMPRLVRNFSQVQ